MCTITNSSEFDGLKEIWLGLEQDFFYLMITLTVWKVWGCQKSLKHIHIHIPQGKTLPLPFTVKSVLTNHFIILPLNSSVYDYVFSSTALCNVCLSVGICRFVAWSVGHPLRSRMKYLELLYYWCPEDEAYWLWCSSDFPSCCTTRMSWVWGTNHDPHCCFWLHIDRHVWANMCVVSQICQIIWAMLKYRLGSNYHKARHYFTLVPEPKSPSSNFCNWWRTNDK